jgi:hypothetical protein
MHVTAVAFILLMEIHYYFFFCKRKQQIDSKVDVQRTLPFGICASKLHTKFANWSITVASVTMAFKLLLQCATIFGIP